MKVTAWITTQWEQWTLHIGTVKRQNNPVPSENTWNLINGWKPENRCYSYDLYIGKRVRWHYIIPRHFGGIANHWVGQTRSTQGAKHLSCFLRTGCKAYKWRGRIDQKTKRPHRTQHCQRLYLNPKSLKSVSKEIPLEGWLYTNRFGGVKMNMWTTPLKEAKIGNNSNNGHLKWIITIMNEATEKGINKFSLPEQVLCETRRTIGKYI